VLDVTDGIGRVDGHSTDGVDDLDGRVGVLIRGHVGAFSTVITHASRAHYTGVVTVEEEAARPGASGRLTTAT
jgi:hypothetical protein